MSPEEQMLISAVRYALGRMSPVVVTTCNYVAGTVENLSLYCLNVMIRDIEDELKICHDAGHTLGMECDEKDWLTLLELLKKEREKHDYV